jgi:hypothetical protein
LKPNSVPSSPSSSRPLRFRSLSMIKTYGKLLLLVSFKGVFKLLNNLVILAEYRRAWKKYNNIVLP